PIGAHEHRIIDQIRKKSLSALRRGARSVGHLAVGHLGGWSFGGFETALRATAGLLHDLLRVDRAFELGEAFLDRARSALRAGARGERRRADLVRLESCERALPSLVSCTERQLATAHGDIDVA